jgi:opacity protein-like surface antigen
MKKVILLSLISIVLAFGSSKALAQSFNAGLIVGPTFCQVDGDHYAGFHQVGFTAGAYANLPVANHLSVQMELKYSLFGAHSSGKEVSEYYYTPYSLRLHYAEIPLMLRYDLGVFRIAGRPLDFITLEAGISADVRLRATEDVDTDFQVTTSRWNLLSATANAGVHFAFNDHLGLGARFMYSVAPCRFTGNPGWFYNQYYNKVIQITLTYNLNSPLR